MCVRHNKPIQLKSDLQPEKQLYLPLDLLPKINTPKLRNLIRRDFFKMWGKVMTPEGFLKRHNIHIGLVQRIVLGRYSVQHSENLIEFIEGIANR